MRRAWQGPAPGSPLKKRARLSYQALFTLYTKTSGGTGPMDRSGIAITRQSIRSLMLAGLLAPAIGTLCVAQTGTPVAALSSLDGVMQQALPRYSVKGGALAVVKDGHLVFARGYGWAESEAQLP